MNTPKQRVTLNNLTEPQQLRELNRQLEWIWNQLMGGLTQKALSTGLNSLIESKAGQAGVDALGEEIERQATLISQNAGQITLAAEVDRRMDERLTSAEAALALTPDHISAAVRAAQPGGANLIRLGEGLVSIDSGRITREAESWYLRGETLFHIGPGTGGQNALRFCSAVPVCGSPGARRPIRCPSGAGRRAPTRSRSSRSGWSTKRRRLNRPSAASCRRRTFRSAMR